MTRDGPNLQNIPIRTAEGRRIRDLFFGRGPLFPVNECPACHADLTGQEIPSEQRKLFGGATHFDRRLGRYDIDKDRTTHWMCPDCGHEWSRDESGQVILGE